MDLKFCSILLLLAQVQGDKKIDEMFNKLITTVNGFYQSHPELAFVNTADEALHPEFHRVQTRSLKYVRSKGQNLIQREARGYCESRGSLLPQFQTYQEFVEFFRVLHNEGLPSAWVGYVVETETGGMIPIFGTYPPNFKVNLPHILYKTKDGVTKCTVFDVKQKMFRHVLCNSMHTTYCQYVGTDPVVHE